MEQNDEKADEVQNYGWKDDKTMASTPVLRTNIEELSTNIMNELNRSYGIHLQIKV